MRARRFREARQNVNIHSMRLLSVLVVAFLLFACSYAFRLAGGSLSFMNMKLLDGWSLAHLLLFAVATYVSPSHGQELFLLGVVWEGVEAVLETHGVPFIRYKPADILYNGAGICMGWYLHRWIGDTNALGLSVQGARTDPFSCSAFAGRNPHRGVP